jgi:glutamate-1-semialdehyde 2,1-aminomutase
VSRTGDPTLEAYRTAHPRSAELFRRQSELVPGGLTHRSRHRLPFPLFVTHGDGAYKHTVDGRRLIDYWMGHGALLLGNADPVTAEAVREQAGRGFHAGGETETGLRWAELVCELVPSARRVRFTSSGGEATQLAVRLARAATGRTRVVAFRHGFHGWAVSDDPNSSHPPSRTSSIEEPVATIPSTNTPSPITITAGITSGRFTTRTAISRRSYSMTASRKDRSHISVSSSSSSYCSSPISA